MSHSFLILRRMEHKQPSNIIIRPYLLNATKERANEHILRHKTEILYLKSRYFMYQRHSHFSCKIIRHFSHSERLDTSNCARTDI